MSLKEKRRQGSVNRGLIKRHPLAAAVATGLLLMLLLSHREDFAATVTDKLLTYALGRGTEYYDAPAVRAIVHGAGQDDYRWSALILGIVRSTPFQMRMPVPETSTRLQ